MVTINPNTYVTAGDGASQSLTNFTLVTPVITTPTITGGTHSSGTLSTCTITNPTITGGTWNGFTYNDVNGVFVNLTAASTTSTTGDFTTLTASSSVSGTGFDTYLASPPAIGGTVPAAATFTTLNGTTITGTTINGTTITGTTVNGTTIAGTTYTASGNLTFNGTTQRIRGDFTNATIADRLLFQTSTADSMTSVRAIPNGTSQQANLGIINNSNPTNASEVSFRISDTEGIIQSGIFGTGTYLPLNIYTNNAKQATIDTSGNLAVVGGGKIGYGTGAGGAQTQGTNKATAVTLNASTGQITMNGAILNANTTVSFTLTNSKIAATDVVLVNHASGGTSGSYQVWATNISAGSCTINLRNITAGNLTETPVLNFAVIRGATS